MMDLITNAASSNNVIDRVGRTLTAKGYAGLRLAHMVITSFSLIWGHNGPDLPEVVIQARCVNVMVLHTIIITVFNGLPQQHR